MTVKTLTITANDSVNEKASTMIDTIISVKRTWRDREGHWGRCPGYVDATKVFFSFQKSDFRDVRTDYNLNLSFFLVKKQISMADLSRGHINICRRDTKGLCFSRVYIQEVSARRVRKELINHNLYLFARPLSFTIWTWNECCDWLIQNSTQKQHVHLKYAQKNHMECFNPCDFLFSLLFFRRS